MTKLEQAQRILFNTFSSGCDECTPIPNTLEDCLAFAEKKLDILAQADADLIDSLDVVFAVSDIRKIIKGMPL